MSVVWPVASGHKAPAKLVSYKYGNREEGNYKKACVNDWYLSFIIGRYVTFLKVQVAEM